MDYEKLYKEALSRAREYHIVDYDNTMKLYAKGTMEYLFPELKEESKDEKVRMFLLRCVKQSVTMEFLMDGINKQDCIAWLEKQGESSDKIHYWTKEEIEPIISDYLRGAEHYGGMISRLRCLKPKSLEEQGEQKPFDYENANIQQKDFASIEPKFKVGDWVVYNRDDCSKEIIQVYDIRDGRYYFTDNVHLSWSIKECDEKCHLWTIQDAKDGDVLASNKSIFIFQEEYICEKPTAYCGLMNGLFIEGNGDCWTNEKCYPATQKQRGLLFTKMKEAGYEWDAEKKELEKRVIDEGKSEMDYCFTKMMNGEKISPTWSEEDDKMLIDAIGAVGAADYYTHDDKQEIENWLKSLKQRMKGE